MQWHSDIFKCVLCVQILCEASVDVNKILTNHELPSLLIEHSHCSVATLVQYIRLNHRLPHRLRHKVLSLHSSIAICFPMSSWGILFSWSPWKALPFDPHEKTFPSCWPLVLLCGKDWRITGLLGECQGATWLIRSCTQQTFLLTQYLHVLQMNTSNGVS